MFGARLWSPGPTLTTEFLIFLAPPPHSTTSTPPPWSRWECLVKTPCRRARPVVRFIKHGEHGSEAGWPPGAPGGLISTDQCYVPQEGRGMLFQSGSVHSDGWENIFLRSVSQMDEFCLHITTYHDKRSRVVTTATNEPSAKLL
ncbi:hypothetical protein ABVT39_019900 [Epinephelus coioides]